MNTYCIYDDEYGLGSESPLGNDEDHHFCHFHIDADAEQSTELEHLIVDFKAARKTWEKAQSPIEFLSILHHSGRLASR